MNLAEKARSLLGVRERIMHTMLQIEDLHNKWEKQRYVDKKSKRTLLKILPLDMFLPPSLPPERRGNGVVIPVGHPRHPQKALECIKYSQSSGGMIVEGSLSAFLLLLFLTNQLISTLRHSTVIFIFNTYLKLVVQKLYEARH